MNKIILQSRPIFNTNDENIMTLVYSENIDCINALSENNTIF